MTLALHVGPAPAFSWAMSSWKGFLQGVGAGLGVAVVAFWVSGALRRRRTLKQSREGIVLIDGVGEADPVALSARPPAEAASDEPLASEMPDFVFASQRW